MNLNASYGIIQYLNLGEDADKLETKTIDQGEITSISQLIEILKKFEADHPGAFIEPDTPFRLFITSRDEKYDLVIANELE